MRYLVVFAVCVALGYGAVRVNRRARVDRPTPSTLVERYGWEMDGE